MQNPDHNDESHDESLQAPPRLVSALARIPREEIFVPRTVDETILGEAKRQLEKPERSEISWRRWLPRFAAVAIVLALVGYLVVRHGILNRAPAYAREDLNHDGRVDILDAFALARQLKSGQAAAPVEDVNGDGIVDGRDVETIASHAVRLEKGGHS
jgi:hypothetical protein